MRVYVRAVLLFTPCLSYKLKSRRTDRTVAFRRYRDQGVILEHE